MGEQPNALGGNLPQQKGGRAASLHYMLAASSNLHALLRGMVVLTRLPTIHVSDEAKGRASVSVQSEGRFVRAARFLQKYGYKIGYGISTLALTGVGLGLALRSFSGWTLVIWFAIIVVLLIAASWLFVESLRAEDRREKDKDDLQDAVDELRTQKSDLEDTVGTFQQQYTTLFAGLLSILANQVLEYGPTERVSVYRYDPERNGFRMVSRYSDNTEFGKPSERTFYPADEGAIGEAWSKARFTVAELPDPNEDLNEYLKLSEQEWRIKQAVAERFQMKSCCYAAFPLKHPHGAEHGNIAVVVFESIRKGSLRIDRLRSEMEGAEGDRIARFLLTMESIEPRADIAYGEGV